MKLLDIIKALAHEKRLRIFNLLRKQSLCVCEIRNIMDINQSNASLHLLKFKNAGLIEDNINLKQIDNHSFIKKY